MRMPRTPPDESGLFDDNADGGRVVRIINCVDGPSIRGKYLHWDKLRHHTPPEGVSSEEWWLGLKFRRRQFYKETPLYDRLGTSFVYAEVAPIPEVLNKIDLGAGGLIAMPEQVTNPDTRDRYYVGSLIEEAITSSQLEGATTTRVVAKELIRSGRKPRDRSEQMILNNYRAMKRINALRSEPLTKKLIIELHGIVTKDALDDPTAEGRFRKNDDNVRVENIDGIILHTPPSAHALDQRMVDLCKFANDQDENEFIHPVLRSIMLHFWLAYDHPFVDGNGRTARALFYWSMLHRKYWLCEFISISHIIRKAPAKYGRAFLYTETDSNDLTYFLLYHLEVMRRAVDELHTYVAKKTGELKRVEGSLKGLAILNHRQRALLGHAIRHPSQRYTIESHRVSNDVAYETARGDLLDLHVRGLLESVKVGRTYYFMSLPDLEARLAELSP